MGAGALEEVVEILYRARSLHKCKLIMVCGNISSCTVSCRSGMRIKSSWSVIRDKMAAVLKGQAVSLLQSRAGFQARKLPPHGFR